MSTYILPSEPAVSSVAENDLIPLHDTSGNLLGTITVGQARNVMSAGVVTVTDSTVSLTAATHGGRTTVLSRAAGIAAALPAASGSGAKFEIFIGASVTSNSTTIKVANSSDTMRGNAILGQDSADTAVLFEAGSTADTITLNGSTTGGLLGDTIVLQDVAANLWSVRLIGAATGTEATPFSATV